MSLRYSVDVAAVDTAFRAWRRERQHEIGCHILDEHLWCDLHREAQPRVDTHGFRKICTVGGMLEEVALVKLARALGVAPATLVQRPPCGLRELA